MGPNAKIARTENRGRLDLSTTCQVQQRSCYRPGSEPPNVPYVKILGAKPVSAKAVKVRDPAYTQERPMDNTEMQIVALIKSALHVGQQDDTEHEVLTI